MITVKKILGIVGPVICLVSGILFLWYSIAGFITATSEEQVYFSALMFISVLAMLSGVLALVPQIKLIGVFFSAIVGVICVIVAIIYIIPMGIFSLPLFLVLVGGILALLGYQSKTVKVLA